MKKKMTAFVLAGAMLLAFAGCSGKGDGSSVKNVKVNNPDDVLTYAETVANALEGQSSGKASSTFHIDGKISIGEDTDGSMDLTYDGTSTTEVQYDGWKTKTSVDGTLNLMTIDIKSTMESYTTSEDGDGHDVYAKVDSYEVDDSWKKAQKDGSGVPVIMDAGFYRDIKDDHIEATLEAEQEKVGETDCRVLSVRLTGPYVQSAVGNMTEYIFGVQADDWSSVSADAKIYIDAATGLPVQMTTDAQAAADQIMELCRDQNALTINVDACTVTYTTDSWGDVTDITLDEERNSAETSEDGIRLYRPELFN